MRRRRLVVSSMLAVICALPTTLAWLTSLPSADALQPVINAVANPDASSNDHGWEANSDGPQVSLTRVKLPAGSPGKTGVLARRVSGGGAWSEILVQMRSPQEALLVGHRYRTEVWVRDVQAAPEVYGLLLANGSYQDRPTPANSYEAVKDKAWHLVGFIFTVSASAARDTAVYIAMPTAGALNVEFTGASVKPILSRPPVTAFPATRKPSQVLSFAGDVGSPPASSQWSYDLGGHGWGNGELQSYTRSARNVSLDGQGNLVITARRESVKGSDGVQRAFSSARIQTRNKVSIQPGSYVEASIAAPTGDGVWPAFWTIGSNFKEVGWPASGEIDIFEGTGATPTIAHSALHMSALSALKKDQGQGWDAPGGSINLGVSVDAGPHLYGVYFDANTVKFYIDHILRRQLYALDAARAGGSWPFGHPQNLVLNVAVASDTPNTTSFPVTMTVGPISVWSGGVPFAD